MISKIILPILWLQWSNIDLMTAHSSTNTDDIITFIYDSHHVSFGATSHRDGSNMSMTRLTVLLSVSDSDAYNDHSKGRFMALCCRLFCNSTMLCTYNQKQLFYKLDIILIQHKCTFM